MWDPKRTNQIVRPPSVSVEEDEFGEEVAVATA